MSILDSSSAPGLQAAAPAPGVLESIALLATAALPQIAVRLRDALAPEIRCAALAIFTEECTDRPRKLAGDQRITDLVGIAELDRIRGSHPGENRWSERAEIGGAPREILALRYPPSNALLVLIEPRPAGGQPELIGYLWNLAANRIREKVADAPPSYLRESRAVSAERVRVTGELVEQYATSLDILLATLRSTQLDDAAARVAAIDLAAKTLVGLKTVDDRTNSIVEEPVASAFTRLRDDLRPLTTLSGVDLQFVEPPKNGRALPGEVAHAARAIVRGLALAMMEQEDIQRIRVQWDCDGENLLINVRDDARGGIDPSATALNRLVRRVEALNGLIEIEVMSGWGTEVSVRLPLDAPPSDAADIAEWSLGGREFEVLQLLAAGQRNRAISQALGISENTVKFHVRNLFKKMGVSSRAQAVALAHSHGVASST